MYDKKVARRIEQELQELFGETSYQLEIRSCTGKYHGHKDYTLVFGSGRRLYVGLDSRNYICNLQDILRGIRSFRAHQKENAKRITEFLRENNTPFCNAEVEIVPYDETNSLTLYAAVVLSTDCGIKFIYRTTSMYGFLVGYEAPCFSFENCMNDLLKDIHGKMTFTRLYEKRCAV